MRSSFVRGGVSAVLAVLLATNARATDSMGMPPTENWNKVESLRPGTDLSVDLKYGEAIDGKYVQLDSDSVLLRTDSTDRLIPKNAVSQISIVKPGSRVKNAAIAGGVFFGIGFAIGCAGAAYIADQNSATAGERVQAGSAFGGLFGGIAAAIASIRRPGLHREVIYRSR